jgi:hypothetical protein
MSKRREILLGVCSIPIAGVSGLAAAREATAQDRALREIDEDRARELLLEAGDELAVGRHARARLRLKTLLNVYGDSAFVPQARILLFYSTATSYPSLYEGKEVLERVQLYLEELESADKSDASTKA